MNKNIDALCPVVAAMCRTFIEVCKQKGHEIMILSTVRTDAEQLALYAQGRKSLQAVNALRAQAGLDPIGPKQNKSIVTKLLTSIHQFTCAFDSAILSDKTIIWDKVADIDKDQIPDYREIGLIGEAIGFRWGGRFGVKPENYEKEIGWDPGHFEYTGSLTVEDLKAGKRPHEAPKVKA